MASVLKLNTILIAVFIFTATTVFGQLKTNKITHTTKRSTESYFVIKKGDFKGKRHGEYLYTSYNKNVQGLYNFGEKEGIWQIKIGSKTYERYYHSDHLDSLVYTVGKMKNVVLFSEDEKDTLSHVQYHPSGAIISTDSGISRYYLEGGTIFVGEQKTNLDKSYRSKLATEIDTLENRNTFISRYAEGSTLGIVRYNDSNKLHGEQLTLYQNGDTAFVRSYSNRKPDGRWRGYYPNKAMAFNLMFDRGRMLEFSRYDELGNLDTNLLVREGNGLFVYSNKSYHVDNIYQGQIHGISYSFLNRQITTQLYQNGMMVEREDNSACPYEEFVVSDDAVYFSRDIHADLSGEFLIKAEYAEGMNAMYRFISEQIEIPDIALEEAQSGTVLVKFIVEKDGAIKHTTICSKKLGFGLEEASLRVVEQTSGKWKPALLDGFPVRMKFQLPIKFQLN